MQQILSGQGLMSSWGGGIERKEKSDKKKDRWKIWRGGGTPLAYSIFQLGLVFQWMT